MSTTKRILVLDGHPGGASLSRTFAESYGGAATTAGHDVRIAHLAEMHFDADFGQGSYSNSKPLEPALAQLMADLEWADHLVLAFPMWWGSFPAKLKGLIDRAFLPGSTFDMRDKTRIGLPRPLLVGRSARVIVTADTPGWFLRLVYRNALVYQLRRQIFGFVGIRPTRVTYLAGASEADQPRVDRWIGTVERLGAQAA